MRFEPGERFDYQGHLIFNRILHVDLFDSELEGIINRLPEFDADKESARSGFEEYPFSAQVNDHPGLPGEIRDICSNTTLLKYRYEDLVEEEALVEGERTTVDVPKLRDADVFLHPPNRIYIRASKREAKNVHKALSQVLNDHISEIEFDEDFLMWIFYNYASDKFGGESFEELFGDHNLKVELLTDVSITGERDTFGSVNRVEDSVDISRNIPILTGILRGNRISMIGGGFDYLGEKINLEINKSGRIHFKAGKGGLSVRNPLARMATSVALIHTFTEVYDRWKNLPDSSKYPPVSFFEQLYNDLQQQGVTVDEVNLDTISKVHGGRGGGGD